MHVQQAFDVRSNSCHIHSYVHTLTHIQHLHSSTALCKQPRGTCKLTQAMKARQKCRLAGPTTGCWTTQDTCIEEKQRVRQTAVVYTQKKKRDKHACMHMHVCVSVCCYYFANPSTLCVCLPVCTCTSVCPDACIYNAEVISMCNKHLMLGKKPVIYTHTYTHSHTFNTFTQAQHSVNSHEEHANSPKR